MDCPRYMGGLRDCRRCHLRWRVTEVVNQKGIVNTTQANLISKTVATYTRDEVLNAIDSLNKAKTHR